jgi:arylsulfatase A-like enzyme
MGTGRGRSGPRSSIFGAALSVAALAATCGAEPTPAPSTGDEAAHGELNGRANGRDSAPNLVLITVDTLRADKLACYGEVSGTGIDLCELFEKGTRFTWAVSTAPSTPPSVASILTSLYPRDHGVTQFGGAQLAEELLSVAEILSAAGYSTGAIVSNPMIRKPLGLDQGFDHFDDRMTRREAHRPSLRERTAADTTDSALAWTSATKAPYFLWVHYQDPHGPYEPPGASPVRDDPRETPLEVLRDFSGWRGIPAYQVLPGVATPSAYEWRYAQEIRYPERNVKRLVAGLDQLGESPAILLTADHGEAFGEDDFYFAHGHSVGLDQIRVPLLWRPAEGSKAVQRLRRAQPPR